MPLITHAPLCRTCHCQDIEYEPPQESNGLKGILLCTECGGTDLQVSLADTSDLTIYRYICFLEEDAGVPLTVPAFLQRQAR